MAQRRRNTGCGWSAWLGLAGLIILLDQASKWVVLDALRIGETRYFAPFWNWVLTFNPGAAFSFLSSADYSDRKSVV